LAETKSIALAFLQAATQAPQPMHCAASIARSASPFADREGVGVGRGPGAGGDEAAGLLDLVERGAVGNEILDHRERRGRGKVRRRSVSPSLNERM